MASSASSSPPFEAPTVPPLPVLFPFGLNLFPEQKTTLLDQISSPLAALGPAQLQLLSALAKAGGAQMAPLPQQQQELNGGFGNGFFSTAGNLGVAGQSGPEEQQRKRRRAIGNLDNTLDGLVAKRAEQTPLRKRYQTETEAIELPDDEMEIKRLEADPDVCTRMCSECGYQGKWVSEMIRHKRVHTNERPFKCKYCNRTSKWKADLIRHVAKTHGIRVVSKYSRSKAFELGAAGQQQNGGHILVGGDDDVVILGGGSSSSGSESGHDENNNGHRKVSDASGESLNSMARKAQRLSSIARNSQLVARQLQKQMAADANLAPQQRQPNGAAEYKCGLCDFEQNSFPLLAAHLRAAHSLAPFLCQLCQCQFEELPSVGEHFAGGRCPPAALKTHFSVDKPCSSPASGASSPQAGVSSAFVPPKTALPKNPLAPLLFPPMFGVFPPPLFPALVADSAPSIGIRSQHCSSPDSALSTAPSFSSLGSAPLAPPQHEDRANADTENEEIEEISMEEDKKGELNFEQNSPNSVDEHKFAAQMLMQHFGSLNSAFSAPAINSQASGVPQLNMAALGQLLAELQRRTAGNGGMLGQ